MQLLRTLNSQFSLPWVCIGDYNEFLSVDEKLRDFPKPIGQIKAFGNAIQHCNLLELPMVGPLFTWHRGIGRDMVLERLDRCLATST